MKKRYFNGLKMNGLIFGKIGTRFARGEVYGSPVTPGDSLITTTKQYDRKTYLYEQDSRN